MSAIAANGWLAWFSPLFNLVMILFPAIFTLFFRRRPGSEQERTEFGSSLPRLERRLWWGTFLAVAAWAALWRLLPADGTDLLWVLFFPLWFGLAMPVLRARDPGWRPPAQGRRRTASLVARDLSPGMKRAWLVLGGTWSALALGALLTMVLRPAEGATWSPTAPILTLALLPVGGFWAIGGRYFARMSLREPEPMPEDDAEIAARYRDLARLKARGWLAISAGVSILTTLPILLFWIGGAELSTPIFVLFGASIAVGAIGGSYLGIRADLERVRIRRLLAARQDG